MTKYSEEIVAVRLILDCRSCEFIGTDWYHYPLDTDSVHLLWRCPACGDENSQTIRRDDALGENDENQHES